MASKSDKRAVIVSAIELLSETARIPCKHVGISPHQLTPYDAYVHLIQTVKAQIPRETILQLQPGCDPDIPIEAILSPSFVCSLAFTRLMRILSCSVQP
jgi:hypothetical protein